MKTRLPPSASFTQYVFISLGAVFFAPSYLTAQTAASGQTIIAVVGSGALFQQDIVDWQATQACYGPEAVTSRKAGFMRLFEAAILNTALNRQGRPITPKDYSKETARINAETRAPEILSCIKEYFGENTNRYQKVFIRPILAQRFIREFVKSNRKVQEKAYWLRHEISTTAARGIPFKDISSALDVAYSSSVYSLEADTDTQNAFVPHGGWSPSESAFIEKNLKGLAPGQVKPAPVEDEKNIKFVRLIRVDGKKYLFESLTVHKVSTEEYLKVIPKLPCRINDKELYDWVSTIKDNPILAPADIEDGSNEAGTE